MKSLTSCILALGSNLGNKKQNLLDAIKLINENHVVKKISQLYESQSITPDRQPNYFNCCLSIVTTYQPIPLLKSCKKIEQLLGRKSDADLKPRLIDIDIIFYGDKTISMPQLTIPHPRYHERDFVLKPLNDLLCSSEHPMVKKPIQFLNQSCVDIGVIND